MADNIQNKQIPVNLEAETGILNSILIDNGLIVNVIDMIQPEDFYDSKNRIIYNAMLDLYKSNSKIDARLLKAKLEEIN